MTDHDHITPHDARRLLVEADRVSRRAHDAVRWPYVAFILALGIATSFGTFGMAVTTGSAFGAFYVGLLAAVFALIVGFCIATQGRRAFAWSRRWTLYIAAWVVAYGAALAVGITMQGTVLWPAVASAVLLAVTTTCAAVEARR